MGGERAGRERGWGGGGGRRRGARGGGESEGGGGGGSRHGLLVSVAYKPLGVVHICPLQ